MNNDYMDGVRRVINDNITRYCATPYDPISVVNVDRRVISFTIDDQLFFECLLMDIRGYTIRYSSTISFI